MLVRVIFSVACVAAGYHFHPFGLSKLGGRGHGPGVFDFRLPVRDSPAARQHAPLDRRGGGLDPRHPGRVFDGLGSGAHLDPGRLAVVPGCGAAPGDDLHRPGGRREQGRHAQPAGARRPVRQRTQHAAHAQGARYQRDYRRPHRRHLRGALPGRRHADPAIRPARTATRGRFRRLA